MNAEISYVKLLNDVAQQLSIFIENSLKKIDNQWWKNLVFKNISSYGRRDIENNSNDSLIGLNITLLLKILEENWESISNVNNIPQQNKYYVSEMQIVFHNLNNLTHLNNEDFYRDLDMLLRFCIVIGVSEELINNIKDAKNIIIEDKKMFNNSLSTRKVNHYNVGEIVCMKSNTKIKGAIIEVIEGDSEYRYKVFINNEIQTYYDSQLHRVEYDTEKTMIPFDEFKAFLTATQINTPNLSTLYSLNSARVDYIPHQFRPVLKFIRSDRPRLLIADGVGVGKTIEAGLVLRELQARKDVKSVLIICPRPLVSEKKWELEMKRFEEKFTSLNGELLRQCIEDTDYDAEWPEKYNKVIIPYSLFSETTLGDTKSKHGSRNKGLLQLNPPPKFDLVIVDEAHHVRNPLTYAYKAVKFFCDNSEAVLFLTATPIQLGDEDLFVLLNLLRPDLIIDKESFKQMSKPNPYINKALHHIRSNTHNWPNIAIEELIKAKKTLWGKTIYTSNPDFISAIECLSKKIISSEDRIKLINQIEGLHTFSSIINRTRRRDIGNYTIRKPETVNVEFTKEQRILHDAILKVQSEIFTKIHGNANIKFMMTTIRRQIASCIFGLVPFLNGILNKHQDELLFDEAIDLEIEGFSIDSINDQITKIIKLAEKLSPVDPKLDNLKLIIKEKQTKDNNKIMIFSSFRHTLNYLFKNLNEENYRIGLIHGGVDDEDRRHLRKRFEMKKESHEAIDIMLFSEVGCEGLDYQFCDCIVNYDLPWNPMRIEQRIGRIDRNGQKSETASIFNMITPGTVDADIYERCLLRIGVFNESIGGSEEILGKITKEIQAIAENFKLTDEERSKKLQQLADNEIRNVKEQEDLEESQVDLFGIQIPQKQMDEEIENASSFWLSQASLLNLLRIYFRKRLGIDKEYILGEKSVKTLRLSQDARNILLDDFQKLSRKKDDTYREWEKWLKSDNQHLTISFDSESVKNDETIMLITPIHPLIKQASLSFRKHAMVVTAFKVKKNKVKAGMYPFAIYQWKFCGVKEDVLLRPVAERNDIIDNILEMIMNGEGSNYTDIIERSIWDSIDNIHYKLWNDELLKHKTNTVELIKYRKTSLNTSHSARMSILNEQLYNATDKRIIIMKKSEINSAQADYARRMQELDMADERADIVSEAVAYGIIIVEE